MFKSLFSWMQRYERHLSAGAMLAGFIADNLLFERIDFWWTESLFAIYTAACFVSILALHWIESRAVRRGSSLPKWRLLFPIITQFALGGFWSGFVIFYGRAATLSTSWPFLVFMILVLLGSEYFNRYHARLVFTSILFFFALYSYAIFAVPIYTGTIGTLTFLESGAVAIGIFLLFTALLRLVARERFLNDVWRIRAGALSVLVLMNLFYFTNILPPLPLSARAAGVYHQVTHVPGAYLAESETGQSWQVRYLGFAPTLHVVPGELLYAYGSIFAPTAFMTSIVHRWQWYDPAQKAWVLKGEITYPIVGGRDSGYRGYSNVPILEAGQWRVDIETVDGRILTRLPFTIVTVATPPALETVTLK